MGERPPVCPRCSAFVRHGWTDRCRNCGSVLPESVEQETDGSFIPPWALKVAIGAVGVIALVVMVLFALNLAKSDDDVPDAVAADAGFRLPIAVSPANGPDAAVANATWTANDYPACDCQLHLPLPTTTTKSIQLLGQTSNVITAQVPNSPIKVQVSVREGEVQRQELNKVASDFALASNVTITNTYLLDSKKHLQFDARAENNGRILLERVISTNNKTYVLAVEGDHVGEPALTFDKLANSFRIN